jgi:multidrug efflux pump subunit AcrA (membrane-fusion protein)
MDEAMLDEVRAKLALLKAGSREEDITETQSRRDAAKGRVEEATARLGYCSVDAPISGIVLTTNVSLGQLVSTMVPVTLLTMVDDSTRWVRAFVVSVRPSTSAISSSRMICSLFDWQIKNTLGRRRDPPVRRGAKRGLAGEGLSRSASSSRVKARRCD